MLSEIARASCKVRSTFIEFDIVDKERKANKSHESKTIQVSNGKRIILTPNDIQSMPFYWDFHFSILEPNNYKDKRIQNLNKEFFKNEKVKDDSYWEEDPEDFNNDVPLHQEAQWAILSENKFTTVNNYYLSIDLFFAKELSKLAAFLQTTPYFLPLKGHFNTFASINLPCSIAAFHASLIPGPLLWEFLPMQPKDKGDILRQLLIELVSPRIYKKCVNLFNSILGHRIVAGEYDPRDGGFDIEFLNYYILFSRLLAPVSHSIPLLLVYIFFRMFILRFSKTNTIEYLEFEQLNNVKEFKREQEAMVRLVNERANWNALRQIERHDNISNIELLKYRKDEFKGEILTITTFEEGPLMLAFRLKWLRLWLSFVFQRTIPEFNHPPLPLDNPSTLYNYSSIKHNATRERIPELQQLLIKRLEELQGCKASILNQISITAFADLYDSNKIAELYHSFLEESKEQLHRNLNRLEIIKQSTNIGIFEFSIIKGKQQRNYKLKDEDYSNIYLEGPMSCNFNEFINYSPNEDRHCELEEKRKTISQSNFNCQFWSGYK